MITDGDWSKRRQAKTATVRTATVQNSDNWPSHNGDRKNPKSQNGDKKLIQGSNDEKIKYVVGLYILSIYNLYMRHVVVLQIFIV